MKKVKAGLYLRLSKEDLNKNESESIKNQRDLLMDFCKQNALDIVDIYVDDGFSGANFDRPGFVKLLRDINNKKIDTVLTKDLSRLGRDYIQTGYYIEKYFPENNVRYIAVIDNVDTYKDNYINEFLPFKSIVNDMYARDISKKIKSVKHNKSMKGLFIGGKPAYGYKLDPASKNHIIMDEEAAKVVKLIFSMALNEYSARSIAIRLTQLGIKTPARYANIKARDGLYNGRWIPEVVSYMLKNEVYIGNMVQGRVKKLSYKLKKTIKLPPKDWVIVEGTHEPIIDKETFFLLQELISKRSIVKSKTYANPLKGLVFCKECGAAMGVVSKGKYRYLNCRNYLRYPRQGNCSSHSIRIDLVQDLITQEIIGLIKSMNLEQSLMQKTRSYFASHKKDVIKSLESQINIVNKNIETLYKDRLNELIDVEDFKNLYESQLSRRVLLDNEIKQFNIGVDDYNKIHNDFINIKDFKEIIFLKLIKKIEIDIDKRINIYI